MSGLTRLRAGGLALAALVFAVDRVIKAMVIDPLGLDREGESLYLLPIFNLTRANNIGVSLSMLPATSDAMRWLLVAGTSLIAGVVVVWLLRERKTFDVLALGGVLGGALGNIFDRVLYGYVIDYADLHFGTFRPFLIFNLADAAISVGVVIILARALFMREKPPTAHGGPADTPAENPHA